MNELKLELTGGVEYNFEIRAEQGWAVTPGTTFEVSSLELPDLNLAGILVVEATCTLNVELATSGVTAVWFSLQSGKSIEAPFGAEYLQPDTETPGEWNWGDDFVWPKNLVHANYGFIDDVGNISTVATVEATMDAKLELTAKLDFSG